MIKNYIRVIEKKYSIWSEQKYICDYARIKKKKQQSPDTQGTLLLSRHPLIADLRGQLHVIIFLIVYRIVEEKNRLSIAIGLTTMTKFAL